MNQCETNGHSSLQNGSDEDFELMGDLPREDPLVIERRRQRNDEITKKLGAYLLKGYCMLNDACTQCDCILLRTPERQLLCVGCAEVDVENAKESEKTIDKQHADLINGEESHLISTSTNKKKKDRVKTSKKSSKQILTTAEDDNVVHSSSSSSSNYSAQLETKLKWAVDELGKSQSPNRINAMCTVIIKLTETIKALKEYEFTSA